MLSDAALYMDALVEIDTLMGKLEEAIFDTRTSDAVAHDLRIRRKQLADLRALIAEGKSLPHS